MEYNKDFEFYGKSVYFLKEKILAIADLHLGYEEMLEKKGIHFPRRQFEDIIGDLNLIFEKLKDKKRVIEKIIIVGDLKHEFGTVLKQEWKEVLDLIDFLDTKAKKVILVKGNHDVMLPGVLKQRKLEVFDFYFEKGIFFMHGNKIYKEAFNKEVNLIVMGHKHPAITLRKDAKKETYKCFLVGNYNRKKQIMVLPSFFPLTEGMDVGLEHPDIDIKLNLKNFDVYIPYENKVLYFGIVKDLSKKGEFLI